MVRLLSHLRVLACMVLALSCSVIPGIAAAQTETPAAIGAILDLEGNGNLIMRAHEMGQAYPAKINDPVYADDILQTGPGAKALVVLIDESRFTLGENARFKIDDYVYDDENTKINHARYNVLQGIFLYTSGLLAENAAPDVRITTPYGAIGIRGTTVWGGVIEDQYSVFVDSGEISLETNRGRIRVVAGEGTVIRSVNTIPERPKAWATEKVNSAKATVSLKDIEGAKERLAAFKTQQPSLLEKHKHFIRTNNETRQQEKNPRDSIKRLNNKQSIPAPMKKTESEPKENSAPTPVEPVISTAPAPAPSATPNTTPATPPAETAPAETPATVVETAPPAPATTAPAAPSTPPPATPPLTDGVQLSAPETKKEKEPAPESNSVAPPPFPRPAQNAQPLPDNLPNDPAMRQEEIERLNLPQHNPL